MLSEENRLSGAPPAEPPAAAGAAAAVPNPPLVGPNRLLLPAASGALVPNPLPNAPPVLAVEVKLNPEAEPNPEVGAGLLEDGAAKENVEAEGAEVTAEEEPNPDGGCVGAARAPKPVGADGPAEEPNPPLEAAKLKLLACTGAGAGAPKPA